MAGAVRYTVLTLLILCLTYPDPSSAQIPDIRLTSFESSISAAAFYQDVPINMYVTVSMTNEPTGCCPPIPAQEDPGGSNYAASVHITDRDLTIGAEDSTGIPAVTVAVDDAAIMRAGMESGEVITFHGVATVMIPAGVCSSVMFVCVAVLKHPSATWSEDTETNNYICREITVTASVQCVADTVDLAVLWFDLRQNTIDSGSSVGVNLQLGVGLNGARTLNPSSEPADAYSVSMFMSEDDEFDETDRQMNILPEEFSRTASTDFSSSGGLSIGGNGLVIPEPHLDPSLKRLCGAIYLIVFVDAPTVPGNILETDEENNIKAAPLVILCPGDRWSMADFEYRLGPFQGQLYVTADIPVYVNVSVYNTDYERQALYPGRASFRLTLWLHTSDNLLTGEPLQVTQKGVEYSSVMSSPLKGQAVGEAAYIVDSIIWISKDKFLTDPGYTHLVLMVEPPETSDWVDAIEENNFMALPVDISPGTSSQLTDYFIHENLEGEPFRIRQTSLTADGNVIPVSVYDGNWRPMPTDKLSFTGEVDLSGYQTSNLVTKLYWSKDDQFDNSDIDSGIILGIHAATPYFIEATTQNTELEPPSDPSLCGKVWGIIYISVANPNSATDAEKTKFNNFAKDVITLLCHPNDKLGLTDVRLQDPPTLWASDPSNSWPTPLTLDLSISCVDSGGSCQRDNSAVNFQVKLFLTEAAGTTDAADLLADITSNDDLESYSGDGLQTSMSSRRVDIQITKVVTVAVADCNDAKKFLVVQLLTHDGAGDAYMDNNVLSILLPDRQCDTSLKAVDIEATSLSVFPITLGDLASFELDMNLVLTNGKTLLASEWPHFGFKLYVSDDQSLDVDEDFEIEYELTDCQWEALTEEYRVTVPLELSDQVGFRLPSVGLERYCGSQVYIGAKLDSYDNNLDDNIQGQHWEPLETNNVVWSTAQTLHGLDCQLAQDVQPTLSVEVVEFTAPDVMFAAAEEEITLQVKVTSAYDKPIRGGSISNKDFSIAMVLSADEVKDDGVDTSFYVTVTDMDENQYLGIEAGGSVFLALEAKLCSNTGGICMLDNVLTPGECRALGTDFPYILISISDIRQELADTHSIVASRPVRPVVLTNMLVRCASTLDVEILSLPVPDVFMAYDSYTLEFEVKVIHLNKGHVGGQFQTNVDNYNLEMNLMTDRPPVVSDIDHAAIQADYRTQIEPDGFIVIRGTASLDFTTLQCTQSLVGAPPLPLYISMGVRSETIHSNLLALAYEAGAPDKILLNSAVDCSRFFVDLSIASFVLDPADPDVVELNVGKSFELLVDIDLGQAQSFSAGQANYDVSFYLTNEEGLEMEVEHTFSAAAIAHFSEAVPADTQHDMSSVGEDDQLVVKPGEAAPFCHLDEVMLKVKVTIAGIDSGHIDPNSMNDVMLIPVRLVCTDDVFQLTGPTGMPSTVFAQTGYPLTFSFSLTNTRPDHGVIPPGLDGKDNFYFEVHTMSGEDTRMPVTDVLFSEADQPKLSQGLGDRETLSFTDVTMLIDIDETLCDAINDDGEIQLIGFGGLGMAFDLMDRVVENNVLVSPVSCSLITTDLSIGVLSNLEVLGKTVSFSLTINLGLTGVVSLPANPAGHFDYKLWLSHDPVLDMAEDVDLLYDTSYYLDRLGGEYSSSGPLEVHNIVLDSVSESELDIPDDFTKEFCGRSYLIVQADSGNTFIETDETNNVMAAPLIVICSQDIYHVGEVAIYSQDVFFPDLPALFKVDLSVFNAQQLDIASVSAPDTNFEFKLYAQKGDRFDPNEATDITPDAWTYSDPAQMLGQSATHNVGTAKEFSGLEAEITLDAVLCAAGVNYLLIGVELVNPLLFECITYNNFYAQPIICNATDSVDVRVLVDRNGLPTFRLDTDKQLVLGQPKPFLLELEVLVTGSGGWSLMPGPPVFVYTMEVSDGTTAIPVPVVIDSEIINAETTTTRTLNLGGDIVLPPATFVPLCGVSGLSLTLTLDTENSVVESNELNNIVTIPDITITDGGSGTCSGGFDLLATHFEVLPKYTHTVLSTDPVATDIDFTFEFEVAEGESASVPSSFSYKLVMSPTMDPADPQLAEVANTATPSNVLGTTTVTGSHPIRTSVNTDGASAFCGMRPYLGVMLDDAEDIEELDENNNYAWQQVIFNCPDVEAIAMLTLELSSTDHLLNSIMSGTETVITFHVSVINKGNDVPDNLGSPHFDFELYLSADTSIEGLTPLAGVTIDGVDTPARDVLFQQGQVLEYMTATATLTLSATDCLGMQYLCINMAPTVGDTYELDNYQCIDVITGPIMLDCARDISIADGSATIAPSRVTSIYQDTLIPVEFTATVGFIGQVIAASESQPNLGFQFYLSDRSQVTPDSLNTGLELLVGPDTSVELNPESLALMTGELVNGGSYDVEGLAEIMVHAQYCEETDRYLCVRYMVLREMDPAFRDMDGTNDFQCVDVSAFMVCNDETRDLEPIWLQFARPHLRVDDPVTFDLQVKVDLRGDTTSGPIQFESKFYLSTDDQLDELDEQVAYSGFSYSPASEEQQRLLTEGVQVINLAGIPLTISSSLLVSRSYCGAVYIIYDADPDNDVEERYENNNELAAPSIIQCDDDELQLTDMSLDLPSGLWSETSSPVHVSFTIRNMAGRYLPLSTVAEPTYRLVLYARGAGTDTDITGSWDDVSMVAMRRPLAEAQEYRLEGVMGQTDGSAFTTSVCDTTQEVVVCVETGPGLPDAVPENNCVTASVSPEDLQCQTADTYRDLELLGVRVSETLQVPGSMDIHQSFRVSVGSSAPDIYSGEFISALYLSKDNVLDESDLRYLEISNEISVPASDVAWTTVELHDHLPVPPPNPNDYCGLHYLLVMIDADDDIRETDESNNVLHRQVNVLCSDDHLALSPVLEFNTGDHVFIEGMQQMFDLDLEVAWESHQTEVVMATENIKVTVSIQGGDPVAEVQLAVINSLWDGEGQTVSPSLGAAFPYAGHTNFYHIHGPLSVPLGTCAGSATVPVTVTVEPGESLAGLTETLLENNAVVFEYPCTVALSRDLIAHPVQLRSGEVADPTFPLLFTVDVELQGLALPAVDTTPTAAPFTLAFYASRDERLSREDVRLMYQMSAGPSVDLNEGIAADSTVTLTEFTSGVEVPALVCGAMYLLVVVDDTNRIQETSEANNIAATRVHFTCPHDIFEVAAVNTEVPTYTWPGSIRRMTFDLAVTNGANQDVGMSGGGLPLVVTAVLSPSDVYDPLTAQSLEVDTTTLYTDLDKLSLSGLPAGSTLWLNNLAVFLETTPELCATHKYLLLGVLPVALPVIESELRNNFQALALNTKCTPEMDLSVFSFSVDEDLDTGSEVSFSLVISAELADGATMDVFQYRLWLSHNDSLERGIDYPLNYNIPAGKPFTEPLTQSELYQNLGGFSESSTGLHVPDLEDIDPSWCGSLYLLAELDTMDDVAETSEDNNVASAAVSVTCTGELFSLSDLLVTTTTGAPPSPTQQNLLTFDLHMTCLAVDGSCPSPPADPNQAHYTFDVKVYDNAGLEIGDMSPAVIDLDWVSTQVSDNDDLTYMIPDDGLRLDFSTVKGHSVQVQGMFSLADPGLCPRVHNIGLVMRAGAESKVRMVHLPFDCRKETLDLMVHQFNLVGDATEVDLTTGAIDLELIIKGIASEWPPNPERRPLFTYRLYASEDDIIDPNDLDLGYVPPEVIMDTLEVDIEPTMTFTLSDSSWRVPRSLVRHLCGVDGVHIGVIVDPLHELRESDLENNIRGVPVTFVACADGIDVKLLSLTAPPVVLSGEQVPLALETAVVLTGDVEISQSELPQQNYYLNMRLLDDRTQPPLEHALLLDTSGIVEMRNAMLPSSAVSGVATTYRQSLTPPSLNIPPDYVLCGKSWMLEVMLTLDPSLGIDLDISDNVIRQNIHIACPADQLALRSIDIVYWPDEWWSESTNRVDFYISVINAGADIAPAIPVFVLEQYLSMDSVLDTSDIKTNVTMSNGDYVYDHREAVPGGQIVRSTLLRGDLIMPTLPICTEAKESTPTVFWKLVPATPELSMYTGNDILSRSVDKSTLRCDQINVDLGIESLTFPNGSSLVSGDPVNFLFIFTQAKTQYGIIPDSSPDTDDLSMRFDFYLSQDALYGVDDTPVELEYTTLQIETLQGGILQDSPHTIPVYGDNLILDVVSHPEYGFYCGATYLVVMITNLKHVTPVDPVPLNNAKGVPIMLMCPEDVLETESVQLEPVAPQRQLFPGTTAFFRLSVEVINRAGVDIPDSRDQRPLLTFRVFMSYDMALDILTDPELTVTLPDDLVASTRLGIAVGQSSVYEGDVTLSVDSGVCTFYPKFLMVFVQKEGQMNQVESVVSNNYQYLPIGNLFNCTLSTVDLSVESFTMTKTDNLVPGEPVDFTLTATASVMGSTVLGTVDSTYIFSYQFFLSRDDLPDPDDLGLGYSMVDHAGVLTRVYLGSVSLPLNSGDEKLVISPHLDPGLCGHSYVIVLLDDTYSLWETDEHNNHRALPVFINCYRDVLELSNVQTSMQPEYFKSPAELTVSFTITNRLDVDITEETDRHVARLKLYITSSSPDSVLHEITPVSWSDSAGPLQSGSLAATICSGCSPNVDSAVGTIDISSACQAGLDPIVSGTQSLVFVIQTGDNTQVATLIDAVPVNNRVMQDIVVDCESTDTIDLSVSTSPPFSLVYGDVVTFDDNTFNLAVDIAQSGIGGWEIQPSDAESPMMFQYRFLVNLELSHDTEIIQQERVLDYDITEKKEAVNAAIVNGQTIDLSDSNYGFVLPEADWLYMCLADSISVTVQLDSGQQVWETDENNNEYTMVLQKPSELDCQVARDIQVFEWSISDLTYAALPVEEPQAYNLRAMLVLVGGLDSWLDGLLGTAIYHMHIQFFLSVDHLYDDEDFLLDVTLSAGQLQQLQDHATDLDFMELGGEGLTVPLNGDTYQYCWQPVYVGVMLDSDLEMAEVNEDNNAGFFEVVLDCGDTVNECASGYDSCDGNATCTDMPRNLYSFSGQGFQCECNKGYTGNGITCRNIDECTEEDEDGQPLHNCDSIPDSTCHDLEGFLGLFDCVCQDGFEKTGSDSLNQACTNVDECVDPSLNNCDPNAVCTDTVGLWECSCPQGFSGDGLTCENIDDCTETSCLNGGTCVDAVNSFYCECPRHYEGSTCQIANGHWGAWGGWGSCLAECGPGDQHRERFCDSPHPANNGRNCAVVDGLGPLEKMACNDAPCTADFDWCAVDVCNQAMGGECYAVDSGTSYVCQCRHGFRRITDDTGNFVRCQDINECTELSDDELPLHDCDALATCINTVESYNCTCKDGFHGPGNACEDVDECAAGTAQCDVNADCINEPGTYRCECREGYKAEKLGDPLTGVCIAVRLMVYGEQAGDTLIDTVSTLTQERVSHLIEVPHGLPGLSSHLYVSENGIIVAASGDLDDLQKDTFKMAINMTRLTLTPDMGVKGIIAPFWADTLTEANTSVAVSKIWYQSCEDPSAPIFQSVSDLLASTLAVTSEDFSALFVLKVTWQDMAPVYSALQYELNTFQALVVTDYDRSYAIYLYDTEGMNWNPVYSPNDILVHHGYPAWIGHVTLRPDGTMYTEQDVNSGKWSNDPLALNAYRVHTKVLYPGGLVRGVLAFRLDENAEDYSSPRAQCLQWYTDEAEPSAWALTLVNNCPAIQDQAMADLRFTALPADTTSNDNTCFDRKFTRDNGATIQCCYDAMTGALLTILNTDNALSLAQFSDGGFVTKHRPDATPGSGFDLDDLSPFTWCCQESREYGSEYCEMYTGKRPMSSSENYDYLHLGFVHGDPHFTTLDGYAYTFNGFSEYVLLRSTVDSPIHIMLQIRMAAIQVNDPVTQPPRGTRLSAIAIQVGSATAAKIQVYLNEAVTPPSLVVYADNTLLEQWPNTSYAGIHIGMSSSSEVSIVFKEDLFLTVTAQSVEGTPSHNMLKAVLAMPNSLLEGQFEGLLGNFDGFYGNDLNPHGGGQSVEANDYTTVDQVYAWANTWSLRMVYGESDLGTNVNDMTLFSQYGEPYALSAQDSAVNYFSLGFSPLTGVGDFTAAECMPEGLPVDRECLFDTLVTGNVDVGVQTTGNKEQFQELKTLLSNRAPVFTADTSRVLEMQVDTPVSIRVRTASSSPVTVTITVTSFEGEQLLSEILVADQVSEDPPEYEANPEWTPIVRQVVTMVIRAQNEAGQISELRPELRLCDCQNSGQCDYSVAQSVSGAFSYAGCICSPGWNGAFCEQDLDGCAHEPCFYASTCTDRTAAEVAADVRGKEYRCSPCPGGLAGDGETCTDLNECLLPETDSRRHLCNQTCVNTAGSYVCSCTEGFSLAEDGRACMDIAECGSTDLCDPVNGQCVDTPPGSYTCLCKTGYQRGQTGNICVDVDECVYNNGGCEKFCVNTEGSFRCECGSGFIINSANLKLCTEINECDEDPCDQTCTDLVGGYECGCLAGFTLEDGRRCKPDTVCTNLECDALAYCGTIDGVEQCFCPPGYMNNAGNPTLCDDIDECEQKTAGCDENSECVNTEGGFHCSCKTGYQLNPRDHKRCDNINECLQGGVSTCDQVCVDNDGSYICACYQGYSLQEDGRTCLDVDECGAGQTNECSLLAECVNMPGSYTCTCGAGFTGSGSVCLDVDECQENRGGCSMACQNTYAGYTCACLQGYQLDQQLNDTCIDVNECDLPTVPCTHSCDNSPEGSYQCTCKSGFSLAPDRATCLADSPCEDECGGGACVLAQGIKTCSCYLGYLKLAGSLNECNDEDECALHTDSCDTDQHAYCENLHGSYHCLCMAGFQLNADGISCSDVNECTTMDLTKRHMCDTVSTWCENTEGGYDCKCKPGFLPGDERRSCLDIDECELRLDVCHRRADCMNTPGTYYCQCEPGYMGTGVRCTDINECENPAWHTCHGEGEQCINLPGSHHCLCRDGYLRDEAAQLCKNINECLSPVLNDCSEPSGCVDTPGGYRCTCFAGSELQNDGKTCRIMDECVNPDTCDQTCVRLDGLDVCECRYPLDRNCQDVDECTECDEEGYLILPCDPTHSTCVNKQPFFKCECQSPWILDADGRGCSETNGQWSNWGNQTSCSKSCHGRITRSRSCDQPRPVGYGRTCPGKAVDYTLCNTGDNHCTVKTEQLQVGVFLTFSRISASQWETIEEPYNKGIARAINKYCSRSNGTFLLCCQQNPPDEGIPYMKNLVVLADIIVGDTYPRDRQNSSRVMIYVMTSSNNQLCSSENDGARKRRDTSEAASRWRREVDATKNDTFMDQQTLDTILSEQDTVDSIQKELEAANLDDYIDSLDFSVEPAYLEEVPEPPTPVPKDDDEVLPLWAIVLIAVFGAIIIIVIIVIIIAKTKRQDPMKKGRVSPTDDTPLQESPPVYVEKAANPRMLAATGAVSQAPRLRSDSQLSVASSRPSSAASRPVSARSTKSQEDVERQKSPLPGMVEQDGDSDSK